MKLCECGCGEPAPIARKTQRRQAAVAGEPQRFIKGHQARLVPKRHGHHRWKGGKQVLGGGYPATYLPDHPHANKRGYVFDHVLVASKALGKALPPTAVVHHLNEDKTDSSNRNLVLCEDNRYHLMLHQRRRSFLACGHAEWRICIRCGTYAPTADLRVHSRGSFVHRINIGCRA